MSVRHWSERVRETIIRRTSDGALHLRIRGGAEDGAFPYFGPVLHEKITYEAGNPLNEGDLLLEVNGQTVAGLTLYDLNTIIAAAEDPVKLKSVQDGLGISKELRRYLTLRTEKGSVDNDLQNMIRDNLYLRTLPCTTRPPREREVDGVDYQFLTKEQFESLEQKGLLVEAGTYEGNFYGTPRPPRNPPEVSLTEKINDMNKSAEELPNGWEMARTNSGQIYYIDHINEVTSWVHPSQIDPNGIENGNGLPPPPESPAPPDAPKPKRPNISRMAENLEGEVIDVILCKGERGFGFTIVGGDEPGEFIQIKSIVAKGGLGLTGVSPGDVLLRVNDETVLGRPHQEVVKMFSMVSPGQTAALQLLRGYPLPAEAENDPEEVETPMENIAMSYNHRSMPDLAKVSMNNQNVTSRTISQPHLQLVDIGLNNIQNISCKIKKGDRGFGFTVADSESGQFVKQVVEQDRCMGLQSDDMIVALNGQDVTHLTHDHLVGMLKAFTIGEDVTMTVRRQAEPSPSSIASSAGALIPKTGHPLDALLTGEFEVMLYRQQAGFGFRILSGEPGNPRVTIGDIVSGGAADRNGQMQRGDRLIAVDGHPVTGLSHSDVIQLMSHAARIGHVSLTLRRETMENGLDIHNGSDKQTEFADGADMRRYHSNSTFKYSETSDHSNDVLTSSEVELTTLRENIVLDRNQDEGFGFVIMSSSRTIPRHRVGKVMVDSPAYRSLLRVGDRVLAVNDVSIDDLSHEKIVECIRKSGQRLRLLTIPILRWKMELARASNGFGFGLRGGTDHNLPFFVLRLASNGAAAKTGEMRIGDIVEEINQTQTDGLTHQEAISLIKSGGNHLTILLKRGNGTVPELVKEAISSPHKR